MRDDMKIGDLVLYYHSNTKPPHVAGIARFAKKDTQTLHPLNKSQNILMKNLRQRIQGGLWLTLNQSAFEKTVSLQDVKDNEILAGMLLVRKGQRLSIQPVLEDEFKEVLAMAAIDLKHFRIGE